MSSTIQLTEANINLIKLRPLSNLLVLQKLFFYLSVGLLVSTEFDLIVWMTDYSRPMMLNT